MTELTRRGRTDSGLGSSPSSVAAEVGEEEGGGCWWVLLRFREAERREREAAMSEVERRWWMIGKRSRYELELVIERGFEEGERRRTKRSSEIRDESKAAKSREFIFSLFFLSRI
ncbi:hypothetical protein U1Q18_003992 [Sarracenia purpurea var. burkii]